MYYKSAINSFVLLKFSNAYKPSKKSDNWFSMYGGLFLSTKHLQ